MHFPVPFLRFLRCSVPRPRSWTAGLLGAAWLAGAGLTACERQPADEPSPGYGHGSAKPGSKGGDKHSFDGAGERYSDSQGTDVKPVKEKKEESSSRPETGGPDARESGKKPSAGNE